MKIDLTQEQYEALLKMVYLAVVANHRRKSLMRV